MIEGQFTKAFRCQGFGIHFTKIDNSETEKSILQRFIIQGMRSVSGIMWILKMVAAFLKDSAVKNMNISSKF